MAGMPPPKTERPSKRKGLEKGRKITGAQGENNGGDGGGREGGEAACEKVKKTAAGCCEGGWGHGRSSAAAQGAAGGGGGGVTQWGQEAAAARARAPGVAPKPQAVHQARGTTSTPHASQRNKNRR